MSVLFERLKNNNLFILIQNDVNILHESNIKQQAFSIHDRTVQSIRAYEPRPTTFYR